MRTLVVGCHNTQNDKDNIEKTIFDVTRAEITFEFDSSKFIQPGSNVDLELLRKFDVIILFCTSFNSHQIQKIQNLSREGILVIDVARCTGLADYHLTNIRRTALVINRIERRFLDKFTFLNSADSEK